MTEVEKLEFRAACDRLLRTASEGKLNINDMEFAVQNVATKDQRSARLTMRENPNEERLREFQRRIIAIADKQSMTHESFDKSASQVIVAMVDDALSPVN